MMQIYNKIEIENRCPAGPYSPAGLGGVICPSKDGERRTAGDILDGSLGAAVQEVADLVVKELGLQDTGHVAQVAVNGVALGLTAQPGDPVGDPLDKLPGVEHVQPGGMASTFA